MLGPLIHGPSRESLAAGQERLETLLNAAPVSSRPAAGSTTAASGPRQADAAALGDDLFAVTTLLAGNPGLRRALTDSSRDGEAKAGFVQQLLQGQVSDQTLDLLAGLVRSPWSDPSDLTTAVDSLAVTALLVSAERAGRLDSVEDELFRFSRTIAADVALRDAFAGRTTGSDRKSALVHALLDGKVAPETLRLAIQAAVSPRGLRTEQVLEHYLDAAAARRRQLVAEVMAAAPLSEEQLGRLSSALRRIYGRDIRINLDVDPEVLGGLRIQVSGELIDNTVLARLNAARRTLAG